MYEFGGSIKVEGFLRKLELRLYLYINLGEVLWLVMVFGVGFVVVRGLFGFGRLLIKGYCDLLCFSKNYLWEDEFVLWVIVRDMVV